MIGRLNPDVIDLALLSHYPQSTSNEIASADTVAIVEADICCLEEGEFTTAVCELREKDGDQVRFFIFSYNGFSFSKG